jgi:hypothetical protein
MGHTHILQRGADCDGQQQTQKRFHESSLIPALACNLDPIDIPARTFSH